MMVVYFSKPLLIKNFLGIFRDGLSWKFFGNFQNIEQFLSYIKLLIMSVNEANPSELEILRQHIIDLEAENSNIKAKKAELEARDAEHLKQVMDDNAKLKARIEKLEKNNGVTT